MRTLVAAGSLLLAACAHAPTLGFRCPTHGGPAWREVTTEHVTLTTDLGSRDAQKLARELERTRAMVLAAMFRTPPPLPGRIEAVAFRNRTEFAEFALPGAGAYFLVTSEGDGLLVLPGQMGWEARAVLAHEITHHVLAQVFARQPRWFAEGMATFLETLGEEGLGAKATIGEIPRTRRAYARDEIAPLLRDEVPYLVRSQYETSWTLVHWLYTRQPKAFGDLQQRFARAEDPLAAWRAALPEYDPDDPAGLARLDRALREHLTERRIIVREIEVDVTPVVKERVLSPADAHALRVRLWPMRRPSADGSEALRAELDELVAEDPAHPAAVRARGRPGPPARADARGSVAAYPDDWRAHAVLADALVEQEEAAERLAARRRAAELAPTEPRALRALALELVEAGRADEAIGVALQSARLSPSTPVTHLAVATALAAAARCGEIAAPVRRAADVMPERAPLEDRRAVLEIGEELARRCRTGDGAAPAR